MFAKLLKHEWKASAGLLSILSACILGIGLLGAGLLRIIIHVSMQPMPIDGIHPLLVVIPSVLILAFAGLLIVAYIVAVPLILLFRFYKTRFSDQGYLTFTLPVKTHHLFLSSALNMLIWTVISIVTLLLALALFILFGVPNITNIPGDPSIAFKEAFAAVPPSILFRSITLVICACVVSLSYSIIFPMTAIVIGAVTAKKHKLLTAIGIGYGISMVNGIIGGIVTSVIQVSLLMGNGNPDDLILLSNYISLIFPLVITVSGYILSIHLMKNKLNLP